MRITMFGVRSAVIWTAVGVALLSAMTLFFYEPGVIEDAAGGTMEGEEVVASWGYMMNGFVALPLVMAVVTLLVSDRVGAWATTVVGVLFGAYGLYAPISEMADAGVHAHMVMTLFATGLIGVNVGLAIARLRRRHETEVDVEIGSARASLRL